MNTTNNNASDDDIAISLQIIMAQVRFLKSNV